MWNIKEEDLDKFRMTCQGRLSPEGATGFMFGGILFSSITIFSIVLSAGWDYCMLLFNIGIVKLEVFLYIIQIILFVIYSVPIAQFKFQKLQTLVVLLYSFQLATIAPTALTGTKIANNSIDQVTLLYARLLFLGAVIFRILIYFHNDYGFDDLFMYVVGTFLMYTIAIGAAEFQLLAYCRFKFPSFNISWEQHKRETPRYQKKNKKSKSKRKA
ncbi:hypothetical protein [Bacillus mycoides]